MVGAVAVAKPGVASQAKLVGVAAQAKVGEPAGGNPPAARRR